MKELLKEIEEKAYYKFLDRGAIHGFELEDWIEAEKEVLESITPKKTKTSKTKEKKRKSTNKSKIINK